MLSVKNSSLMNFSKPRKLVANSAYSESNICYSERVFTMCMSGAMLGFPAECVSIVASCMFLTDIVQALAISKSETLEENI